MTEALALSALLWLPAIQAQPAQGTTFQPRLHVNFDTISRSLHRDGDREIVCGMLVIHKTSAEDPKIILPPRKTGAVVRRIEPQVCGAKVIAVGK